MISLKRKSSEREGEMSEVVRGYDAIGHDMSRLSATAHSDASRLRLNLMERHC